ncbi:fumarylacetoacetate hydrolase family protein [Aurantimonas sp. A3-2-R12]|uniref:fumarylacetoacetate hydrolase family protein n=1 Tax=Aurantimonas sp. A3-2-R12 TaxID=3114362 RepID=UPI002E181635|nr:fumarylacetoacetate hydrolase family protein [Aurantimonas sp. A3-2-R12]
MKFIRYAKNGESRIGVVEDQMVRAIEPAVSDMVELIEHYDRLRGEIRAVGEPMPLDSLTIEAPIPAPRRNIFCVGKNYHAHAKEFAQSGFEAGAVAGAEVDEFPAVFTKPASCVVGTGDVVQLHGDVTQSVDYEIELALVIGKGGRNIPKAKAYEHIWGYMIVNDVTARDRQKQHKQWFLGKALDTFCPMGPWIATADEVDPENLDLETRVNGEVRQKANTSDLIFDIPSLVETISAGLTLVPGDIIATGTPVGVGIGFKPPRFLKPGDVVRMSITGLGTLENSFQ